MNRSGFLQLRVVPCAQEIVPFRVIGDSYCCNVNQSEKLGRVLQMIGGHGIIVGVGGFQR